MTLIVRKPRQWKSYNKDGMHNCRLHGKQVYLNSDVAHGQLCVECVRCGMYVKDVEEEFMANYPNIMSSQRLR